MKMTRHNGRSGKHGVYNPKHNDRAFDVENSDHINQEKCHENYYYDCYQGLRKEGDKPPDGVEKFMSFNEIEKNFYESRYKNFVDSQNERNEKNRHPERNRTAIDLLQSDKTCPEETIVQIGDMMEHVSPEILFLVANEYYEKLDEKYGEYLHILDWALHVDESTPHIHERHVFDCENTYGEIAPQQEKALEKMGFDLPNPNKKPGKRNNRKMVFDAKCREMLLEIVEKYQLEIDREPVYGGEKYLEKQDYILKNQKAKIASNIDIIQGQENSISEKNIAIQNAEHRLDEAILKLEDVEKLSEEVAEAAYKKACDAITEFVARETRQVDLDVMSDYIRRLNKDQTITPSNKRFAATCISKIQEIIVEIYRQGISMIKDKLFEPDIKKESVSEIKAVAKKSLQERLEEAKRKAKEHNERYRKQSTTQYYDR